MKTSFLTRDPNRPLTRLERVAFGLYCGNAIAAADREGVPFACDNRIRTAWDNNPRSQEHWKGVAADILQCVPAIDLGAMTGANPERFTLKCSPRYCRTSAQRALDRLTITLAVLAAGLAGAITGAYLAAL